MEALATRAMGGRDRGTVPRNAYLKPGRQTERGAAGKPAAFVIPAEQHDPLTAQKMVNKLLGQGIEVHQAARDFTHEGRVYGAGTFVVSMAQPKMGVIRWLLGRTFYPDNSYTRNRDGSPIRPYDMSTDNMAEFMGVRVDPVDEAVETELTRVSALIEPAGQVALGRFGYVLDGRLNDSFEAVNLLLAANVRVRRVDRPADGSLRPGDFLVEAGAPSATVADVARETGVDFVALDIEVTTGSRRLTQLRIGICLLYTSPSPRDS